MEKGSIRKKCPSPTLAAYFHYAKEINAVLLDGDNPQYSIYKKGQRERSFLDALEIKELETYTIERVTVGSIQDTIMKYGLID